MSLVRRAIGACLMVVATAATARAQTDDTRYEIAAGVRFVGPESIGRVDANETNPGGGDFRLFTSDSTLHALVGLDARFGVRVTRAIRVEATGSYGASDLDVKLNSDVEGAAGITASERVRQFTVEGAAIVEMSRWRLGDHATPFVSAGAGYLRALHEDRVLVDEGALWHAGGGINLILRPSQSRALGVRLDARAVFQRGIVDDDVHAAPIFGASAFLRF
jgi:opacity protein-like surface antigen